MRSDCGVKRGPRQKPEQEVKPDLIICTPAQYEQFTGEPFEVSERDMYLLLFNATFGLDVTSDKLENSRDSLLRYIKYLRQQGVIETDMPLIIADSVDYAKYCVARKFGLVEDDSGDEPLVPYQTLKSRYITVMER
jgi:hypothetical protein